MDVRWASGRCAASRLYSICSRGLEAVLEWLHLAGWGYIWKMQELSSQQWILATCGHSGLLVETMFATNIIARSPLYKENTNVCSDIQLGRGGKEFTSGEGHCLQGTSGGVGHSHRIVELFRRWNFSLGICWHQRISWTKLSRVAFRISHTLYRQYSIRE